MARRGDGSGSGGGGGGGGDGDGDDGEVRVGGPSPPLLYQNYAKTVQRKWFRARDPNTVVTENVNNVIVRANYPFHVRLSAYQTEHVWTFEVVTIDKPLLNVALALDDHRENFEIHSVASTQGTELGLCSGQEWINVNQAGKSVAGPAKQQPKFNKLSNSTCYMIKICFAACSYGTYRQDVLFGFNGFPAIRRKLCVDCVPPQDTARLERATEYVLNQNASKWTADNAVLYRFESPFVPGKEPRERDLGKIYPYPDKSNFSLGHATLTEEGLTPANYRERQHQLVTVEELARHEQVARYNEVAQLRLSSCYVVSPDTDSASTAKYAPPGELFAQLPLGRDVSEDSKSGRLLLRGCSYILIKPLKRAIKTDEQLDDVFEAYIEDKCNRTVYARLSKQCVEYLGLEADTDLNAQVQFVLNRLPFCEWHRAIDCLPETGLMFPEISRVSIEIPQLSRLQIQNDHLDHRLNSKQREAVQAIATPIEVVLPPILLLGPFGTGKTFTVAQALRVVLTESKKNKVLLCTQSNSAADLYVKEFFDPWYKATKNERLKPVRIYYKGRSLNTVNPVVRDYCLVDKNTRFREPTREDVMENGLIITTLATSCCLTYLDVELTHIVIDEAAQALECEALTALCLARRKTRLVLAGDQKQLTPEVYSDLASERGLGLSLLERIGNRYPPAHPCKILLCQNYRAHADIVDLTSRLFYSGQIQASGALIAHPIHNPLTFFCVQGQEVQCMHSTGFYNDAEAFELADRVDELRRFWPVDCWGPYGDGSIGVVAHYTEQVLRIRNELRKRRLKDVSVERVLNVQGKQYTAVFISTVRTRHCCRVAAERNISDYGFLTNPRLLNTALTRAKCLVAVVGDPLALLTIGSCRHLWRDYFETATLHGVDYPRLKHYLINERQEEGQSAAPLNPLAREFVPRNPQPPYRIEYIPMPVPYPIIYCDPNDPSGARALYDESTNVHAEGGNGGGGPAAERKRRSSR